MPFDAHDDMPDDALLRLFANGNGDAARTLTLRLTPVVMAHAWRMLGNRAEAEDVTQEALMRLWRIAPDWRHGEAKVTTWLYRVVANLCTDRLRHMRPLDIDAVPEPADDAASAEDRLVDQGRMDALQMALGRLPDRQKQAVILRHIEGLGNPEIGEIMGIGIEAVESLTARGKRALAADLAARRQELGYEND